LLSFEEQAPLAAIQLGAGLYGFQVIACIGPWRWWAAISGETVRILVPSQKKMGPGRNAGPLFLAPPLAQTGALRAKG
jgi:hypothetical protein